MNYSRRIERIEKRVPRQHGETVEELLDRLGLGCMKQGVEEADSFLDVLVDRGE